MNGTNDEIKKTDTIELGGVTKTAPLRALIPRKVLTVMRVYLGSNLFKSIEDKLKSPISNFLLSLPDEIALLLTSINEQEWSNDQIELFCNFLLDAKKSQILDFNFNGVKGNVEIQGYYLNISLDENNKVIDERDETEKMSPVNALEFLDITNYVHYFHLINGIFRDPVRKDEVLKTLVEFEYAEDGYEVQAIENKLMLICREIFIDYFKTVHPTPDLLLVDAYIRSTFIPRFKQLFFRIKFQLPTTSNLRLTKIKQDKLSTSASNELVVPLRYKRTMEVISNIISIIIPRLPSLVREG